MPLLDQFPRVAINMIRVPEDRQRASGRAEGRVDTGHIQASISRLGVLMPLLVELEGQDGPSPRWRLISGECRLQSCLNLVASGKLVADNGQDLTSVPVRLSQDLSQLESSLFELTENVKRKDLSWQDLVHSLAGIHRLCRELDPDWTLGETAEVASLSLSTVSLYLRVHAELEDPRISEASTVREAYNVITRRDQRALGDALDELAIVPEPGLAAPASGVTTTAAPGSVIVPLPGGRVLVQAPPQTPAGSDDILHTSFLDWAPQYSGEPFNLIHCDFPYGVEAFQGDWAMRGKGAEDRYIDSIEVYLALVECLGKNLDRIASMSCHLMFWYSGREGDPGPSRLRELCPELRWYSFPMIWHKSDSKGIAADWRHHPRHVYETCLFATRGGRPILGVKNDLYSAPSDASLHAHVKPEPMLRHFMSMMVDQTSRVLDPTCGSGSALRAAESLGAAKVLGLEQDLEACENARRALRNFRALRAAGGGL